MLSSAKKSVPTTKQFIEPYYIEITPGGAITAACPHFSTLLFERNIYNFLGMYILEVFALLGAQDLSFFPGLFGKDQLPVFDLPVQRTGMRTFIIRWLPIPLRGMAGGAEGWQLTGLRMDSDPGQVESDPPEIKEMSVVTTETPGTAGVIRYVSDIVVTTDPGGHILHWNLAAEKLYGIPAKQAMGHSFPDLIRHEYVGGSEEAAMQTLHQQGFWEGERSYVSREGKKSYLISSIRYVKDSGRRITGIMTLSRDITEDKIQQQDRKTAEMQLSLYSDQITGILESITDGFFVLDQYFRVTLWNDEAERITRLSAPEMIGQIIWERLPQLVDTDTQTSFQKAYKKKMTVTFEKYNSYFDRWLEMSIYPSRQGLFAYFKDVTPRKQQEALLALEKKVLEMNTNKRAALRPVLNYFLKGIQKIFPGMYCCVLTLDDDGRRVRLLSAPALPASYAHAIDGYPIGPKAGSCGTAMFRKETVIVSDIETDPLWEDVRDLALRFGLRACWSIPVLNDRDEVLAAFAVYYKTSKSPADAEMEVIDRAASLVTLIIANKRAEEKLLKQELNKQKLIARAMVDAQEKERAEIGKELHDNINQILSTTRLYLELAKNDAKERLNLINRSAGNLHIAIREIRNISRSLVPASIGDLGLIDSLTDLVESVSTTKALNVEFYPVGNFDSAIDDKIKLTLFRIIQEQINNVLKHSGARNLIIELVLEEKENLIELNITDDGKGFDPAGARKGLGLSNIMSRADLFGGKVTIVSAPGQGCQLKVRLPL